MDKRTTSYAVSTVAFGKQSKEAVAKLATEHNWAIEFSSGFAPDPDMVPFYKNLAFTRYPHNYFPAPADPFVMNLASGNETIRRRTIDHCLLGLELAQASGAPCFSAHAGFCIDPDPEQLGRPLDVDQDFDPAMHWSLFRASIDEVLLKAEETGVDFLVENNVLAPFNYTDKRPIALFCVGAEEMIRLVEEVDHPKFGLLLDTAHLKVSAHTLGFDMKEAAIQVAPYVKVVHHSDNDGLSDTNQPLPNDYWAIELGSIFASRLHVLEVKNLTIDTIKQQMTLLQNTYGFE